MIHCQKRSLAAPVRPIHHSVVLLFISISFLCPAPVLAGDSAPDFIKEVRSKYTSIKSFRCSYVRHNPTKVPLLGSEKEMPGHIKTAIGNFKKVMQRAVGSVEGIGLDHIRFEEHLLNGHRHVRVSDGAGFWRYDTYGTEVVRYLDLAYAEQIPLPFFDMLVQSGMLHSESYATDLATQISIKGDDNLDGKAATVVQLNGVLLWVDRETGFVLRRDKHHVSKKDELEGLSIEQLKGGSIEPIRSEYFKDCELNISLDAARFNFDPPQGMGVKTVSYVDGKKLENIQEIPYKKYPFGRDESQKAQQVVKALQNRFAAINDFTARFTHFYVMDHQASTGEGGIVTPREHGDGDLVYKQPGKFTYRYELLSGFGAPPEKGYYVTDGVTIWRDAEREGMPRLVVKQSRELFKKLLQDFQVKTQEDFEHAGGYLRDHNHEFAPDFLTSFYELLPENSLKYLGQEELEGVPVEHLRAALGENNVSTDYWIGKADGVPRKVVELRWRTQEVKAAYELKDVKINAGIEDEKFVFQSEDANLQITDLDSELPRMKQAFKNTFDTPPEKIFTGMFTTPLHQVKQLRGTGKMWMTYDLRIRFYSEKKPEFRPEREIKLVDVDPGEPVGYFVLHFPEDKPSLVGPIRPVSQEFHSDKNHVWFVYNPTTDVYFLRVWGDE